MKESGEFFIGGGEEREREGGRREREKEREGGEMAHLLTQYRHQI